MKRKIGLILLCICLTSSLFISAFGNTDSFSDVNKSDWFYDSVHYVYNNGIFKGTGEDTFSPNMSMTRGMFVTVLGRLAGVNVSEYSGSSGFKDVKESDYYSPYVKWASKYGITYGVSNTEFAPNSTINREQMATFLMRYIEKFGVTLNTDGLTLTNQKPLDTKSLSSWSKDSVLKLWSYGLLNGDGVNFYPLNEAKRCEVAAFIMRLDGVVDNWVANPIVVEDNTSDKDNTENTNKPNPGNNSYNGAVLDGVTKQEAKEIMDEVKEDSAEKLAPQLNYTEEEQMIADYYTDEKEETRLSLLEKHYSLSTIKTIAIDEDSVKLEIKAPNLGLLILDNEIMNSELEGEEFSAFMQETLLDKLEKNQFEYKTFVIDVNYTVEDGEIVLEDSVEYANAIYGDLINVVQGLIDEDMANLGEG